MGTETENGKNKEDCGRCAYVGADYSALPSKFQKAREQLVIASYLVSYYPQNCHSTTH
jgi:hypothetical protein